MLGSTFLTILVLGASVSANIIFNWVQPDCDHAVPPGIQGCLRGQVCLDDNTCEQNWGPKVRDSTIKYNRVTTLEADAREDERCGPDYNDATCDTNGPYGGCCSQHGYCGTTPDHCLKSNGCISGCLTDPPSAPKQPQPTLSQSEPVIGPPSTSSGPSPTGEVTTNGQCGASNNGDICGDWHLGSCCSMYGFCGSTSAHCGEGCQSGPCLQAAVEPAPGPAQAPMNSNPGSFEVVGDSGVPAMHAALMPNGRVIFLDKVEDYTQLKLPGGQYAYSAEYDPVTNKVVPLAYKTNAFCAGGSFLANGTLVSVGGNGPLTWLDPTVSDGFKGLRYLARSSTSGDLDGKDWLEPGNQLNTARWYPSVQSMPDGTLFVASGSLNGLDPTVRTNNNPTYEILDRDGIPEGKSINMQLLENAQPYYMYPLIHLLPTGDLFIFTSKSSELFTASTNVVTKRLPDLPGDYRTYPNTGGSVLLPLSSANNWSPSIIICGGGAYQDITSPTDASCGRISPLDPNPQWEMDAMPEGRGMVEATLLPDGTVLWLNGASSGAQGFGLATDPTLEALIYDPSAPLGRRWTRGASSQIPRLYHSVALLLLDGTVMIAGSNPVQMPVLKASPTEPYPTEFRVEFYTPPYLSGDRANSRPTNISLSKSELYAQMDTDTFSMTFTTTATAKAVKVALYHGGFVTHSLHMSHRMLFLDNVGFEPGQTRQKVTATMPNGLELAPPGPYVVYVVVDGVPGVGQFVSVMPSNELPRKMLKRDDEQEDPHVIGRAADPSFAPAAPACGILSDMPCSMTSAESSSTVILAGETITRTVLEAHPSTPTAAVAVARPAANDANHADSLTSELTSWQSLNSPTVTATADRTSSNAGPDIQNLALGMDREGAAAPPLTLESKLRIVLFGVWVILAWMW